jgi:hypothetical protein
MTTRATVALAAAAAVMLALLVAKVMAASTLAGTLLLCALGIAGLYVTARLIGPNPGHRAAPRRFTADDERIALPCERPIPRAPTEHAPPWEPAPAFQAAPVIEPAAVTSGPPQPEPEAVIILGGTRDSSGQVRLDHIAVLPLLPQCPALPQWVTDILGADSVDGAMAEICSVVHSWESNYTKGDARYLRAITDGAP